MSGHLFSSILLCSCASVFVVSAEDAPARHPIPPASKSAEKMKLVKEVLADEYKDNTPEGRNKLLGSLLAQALTLSDDLDAKYFLLVEARDLAIQLNNIDAAMSACDLMAVDFQIDLLSEKGLALTKLTDSSKSKEVQGSLVQYGLKLIDGAIVSGQFSSIKVVVSATERAGLRSADSALTAKIKEKSKAVDAAIAEWSVIEKARETIKATPLDPVANLSLGKYYVFTKNDWDAGLKNLQLGSDSLLKELSQKDLAATDASTRLSAGDAWWAWSEKQPALQSAKARDRAVELYKLALPELTGLSKTKVEKRIASAPATVAVVPPAAAPQIVNGTGVTIEMQVDGTDRLWFKAGGIYIQHMSWQRPKEISIDGVKTVLTFDDSEKSQVIPVAIKNPRLFSFVKKDGRGRVKVLDSAGEECGLEIDDSAAPSSVLYKIKISGEGQSIFKLGK